MRSSDRSGPAVYVDGYVRVSHVGKRRGPSFISPTVQREAIEDWASRNGCQLIQVYEELDESGARADRPLLEQAVQRIEEGVSSALVVWRVDRFGRSLADGVRTIERIRAAGGGFYSVQDGLDIGTDAGRLVLRILLSVAEYQLDGMRASWDASCERAIRRGVYIATSTPVGYRKTRAGRLRPHPQHAGVMRELFERRAAGEGLMTLCRFLEQHGVRTGGGNPVWTASTLSNVLHARVYLGEVHHGQYVNPKAHPPLADAASWQAAQHPPTPARRESGPFVLRGLVRCAGCRHALKAVIARRPGRTPYPLYRCDVFHAAGRCPAPPVIAASKLEPYVIDAMFLILRNRRREPIDRLQAAEARVVHAEQALSRYRDNDRVAAVIGMEAFLSGLVTRQSRLREARLDVIDARARIKLHHLPRAEEVRSDWPSMTITEKRDVLRSVIDVVFVSPGRLPAAQRVTVCPAGTAPRYLPRTGHRARPLKPIHRQRRWINPVTPR